MERSCLEKGRALAKLERDEEAQEIFGYAAAHLPNRYEPPLPYRDYLWSCSADMTKLGHAFDAALTLNKTDPGNLV